MAWSTHVQDRGDATRAATDPASGNAHDPRAWYNQETGTWDAAVAPNSDRFQAASAAGTNVDQATRASYSARERLQGLNIDGVNSTNEDWGGQNSGSDIRNSKFTNCSWREGQLFASRIENSEYKNCEGRGLNMASATIINSVLNFNTIASLQNATLDHQSRLINTDLRGTQMEGLRILMPDGNRYSAGQILAQYVAEHGSAKGEKMAMQFFKHMFKGCVYDASTKMDPDLRAILDKVSAAADLRMIPPNLTTDQRLFDALDKNPHFANSRANRDNAAGTYSLNLNATTLQEMNVNARIDIVAVGDPTDRTRHVFKFRYEGWTLDRANNHVVDPADQRILNLERLARRLGIQPGQEVMLKGDQAYAAVMAIVREFDHQAYGGKLNGATASRRVDPDDPSGPPPPPRGSSGAGNPNWRSYRAPGGSGSTSRGPSSSGPSSGTSSSGAGYSTGSSRGSRSSGNSGHSSSSAHSAGSSTAGATASSGPNTSLDPFAATMVAAEEVLGQSRSGVSASESADFRRGRMHGKTFSLTGLTEGVSAEIEVAKVTLPRRGSQEERNFVVINYVFRGVSSQELETDQNTLSGHQMHIEGNASLVEDTTKHLEKIASAFAKKSQEAAEAAKVQAEKAAAGPAGLPGATAESPVGPSESTAPSAEAPPQSDVNVAQQQVGSTENEPGEAVATEVAAQGPVAPAESTVIHQQETISTPTAEVDQARANLAADAQTKVDPDVAAQHAEVFDTMCEAIGSQYDYDIRELARGVKEHVDFSTGTINEEGARAALLKARDEIAQYTSVASPTPENIELLEKWSTAVTAFETQVLKDRAFFG